MPFFHQSQFPAQVEHIEDADIQSQSPQRAMDMRRFARQENMALAHGFRMPGIGRKTHPGRFTHQTDGWCMQTVAQNGLQDGSRG